MLRYVIPLLLLTLLTACSSVVIKPQLQSGSQVDEGGQRVTQSAKGVQLAVKLYEANVRPSPAELNHCSFWVEVTNQRNVLLPLKHSDFLLVDDQGRQYQPVDPGELVEQLTDTMLYMIPYPYVGFYYLEDTIRSKSINQLSSESSYFSSRRPEYIESESLPVVEVLPGATVVGALYFPAELRTMNGFQLHYQIGALPGQKSFQISLPFTVEKK